MHILSIVSFVLTMAMGITFIYMSTKMYKRNQSRPTQIWLIRVVIVSAVIANTVNIVLRFSK